LPKQIPLASHFEKNQQRGFAILDVRLLIYNNLFHRANNMKILTENDGSLIAMMQNSQ
jgi:hypothetical protein